MIERGGIYWASEKGAYTGKPRPVLIVQNSRASLHTTITVCLISTEVAPATFFRVLVEPTIENGLERISYVQVDRLYSLKTDSIDHRLGDLSPIDQGRVDAALRRWLDL